MIFFSGSGSLAVSNVMNDLCLMTFWFYFFRKIAREAEISIYVLELLKISFVKFFYQRSFRESRYYSSFEVTDSYKTEGDVFVVAHPYFVFSGCA